MAEYSALLAGAVGLRHWCPSSVVIEGDSALVISQVLGRARCPDDRLRPFRTHILRHLQALRERNVAYTFRHIERNFNTVADDLATTAAILRLSECRCFCSFPSSACAPRVLDSPFAAILNTDTVWSLRHERFCPRTSVESILQPCPPVIEPRVVAAAAPATSALPLSSPAADVPSAADVASGVPAVDEVPSEDMDVAQVPPVAPPPALQPLAADESTDMDTSVAAEVAQDLFRRRRRAQLPRNIPDDIFATVSDSLQLQVRQWITTIEDSDDWAATSSMLSEFPSKLSKAITQLHNAVRARHATSNPTPRARGVTHMSSDRIAPARAELEEAQRTASGSRRGIERARRRLARRYRAEKRNELRQLFVRSEKRCVLGILREALGSPTPQRCTIPTSTLEEHFTATNTPTDVFDVNDPRGRPFLAALNALLRSTTSDQ
ncbi:hypothetical protein DYB32_009475, partial [Aphanomyces invadans]